MNKNIMSFIVIVFMAVLIMPWSLVSASNISNQYTDLSGDYEKYKEAIDAVYDMNIMTFTDGNLFEPEKSVTRAEVAKSTVLILGYGDEVPNNEDITEDVFPDVPPTYWAAGYIKVITDKGRMVGYPDGTFKPEVNYTYAEAITLAIRCLGYEETIDGTWPSAYMQKADQLGLTDGMEFENNDDKITRANFVQLLYNWSKTLKYSDIPSINEGDYYGIIQSHKVNDNIQRFTIINRFNEESTIEASGDSGAPDYCWIEKNESGEIIDFSIIDEDAVSYFTEISIDNNVVNCGGRTFPLSDTVCLYEVTTIRDSDNIAKGFKMRAYNGIKAIDGKKISGAEIVRDGNDENSEVKYIFTYWTDVHNDLKWGKLNSIDREAGTISIDGETATQLDVEHPHGVSNGHLAASGDLVGYIVKNNGEMIRLVNAINMPTFSDDSTATDIIDLNNTSEDRIALKTNDSFVYLSRDLFSSNKKIVIVNVSKDNDTGRIFLDSIVEKEGRDFDTLKESLSDWDRYYWGTDRIILHGVFDENSYLKDGIVYDLSQIMKGDMDGNKKIEIIDVRLLLQQFINSSANTKYTPLDLAIMDMDGNETVDITDVRLLLQLFINQG